MIKYENGHPVVLTLKRLESYKENPPDCHQLLDTIENLQSTCSSQPSVRQLLIGMNAVKTLLDLFDVYISDNNYSVCASLLNVLSTVVTGHSNSVEEECITKLTNWLVKLIDELDENASKEPIFALIAAMYSVLHASCTKNEKNRTLISQTAVVMHTINLLAKFDKMHNNNIPFNVFYPALKEACAFLRALTIDDDMDVEFGVGSENACTIAKSDSCLETFLRLISNIVASSNVQGISDLFQTLSTLITREEICTKFTSLNGIDIIMKTIYYNIKSASIIRSGLMLLESLCGSDACKRSIANWSLHDVTGPQLIIDVYEGHIKNPIVVRYAAGVVAAITLRQPDLGKLLVEAGVSTYLIKTLDLYMSNATTVRTVCRAIRNIVSRSPELRTSFLTLECCTGDTDLEKLLNVALKNPSCCDQAKAALRDLNCAVELQEPWKGPLKSVVMDR
ncbi:unnamed protein product [Trichobilharzia szidati]|nr:unnamed protein product [Trichobilharzia szidati]